MAKMSKIQNLKEHKEENDKNMVRIDGLLKEADQALQEASEGHLLQPRKSRNLSKESEVRLSAKKAKRHNSNHTGLDQLHPNSPMFPDVNKHKTEKMHTKKTFK